ncbi:hypothetical protein NPIL_689061 [Nephila pilipes]|uniref:Uncharacterized protein n=1 Tax=Nephila pilipes TaxID=299642 RepID=A0A8X6NWB3_NEPPI|nr:hypothetical protein NPIL_689061 [Nephila pilipes]
MDEERLFVHSLFSAFNNHDIVGKITLEVKGILVEALIMDQSLFFDELRFIEMILDTNSVRGDLNTDHRDAYDVCASRVVMAWAGIVMEEHL